MGVRLPAQNTYRKISSVSNCEAFQSCHLQARFKNAQGRNKVPAHPGWFRLGRGPHAGRHPGKPPAADGSVLILDVLLPYLGGLSVLAH